MFTALDEKNNKTPIEKSVVEVIYHCPLCRTNLVRKMGMVNAHHFAHLKGASCDPWYNDMSEWHRKWQSIFPIENQEVVVSAEGQDHISDICLENTVIEFQHSSINAEELAERERFYSCARTNIVWMVDCYGKSIYLEYDELDRTYLHLLGATARIESKTRARFQWFNCKRSFMMLVNEYALSLYLHINDEIVIRVIKREEYSTNAFQGEVLSIEDFLREIGIIDKTGVVYQSNDYFKGFCSRYRRQYDVDHWSSWIRSESKDSLNKTTVKKDYHTTFMMYVENEISYEELKSKLHLPYCRPSSNNAYFYALN